MERIAPEAAEIAYGRELDDIEKHKNNLWCYLATVLDSTSLILIRPDCVDNKGFDDGRKACVIFEQMFRSDETVTVIRLIRQVARPQPKENEALQNYFVRANELSTRLDHAREHLSEPLLNAMVLNGLPERYIYFVVQVSVNPAGSFVELRTRLFNYGEGWKHKESVHDGDAHVVMTSRNIRLKHMSSSKYNAVPESSSGQLTCSCFGIKGHTRTECNEKDNADCSYFKQKGHLVQACMNKTRGPKSGSLASNLKSDRATSEATQQDLVVDPGRMDHRAVNKKCFEGLREIKTTLSTKMLATRKS